MEIRELRAFVATVEEGGVSAAARRLHISQPALSQTLLALERELGVQLLVRSSTGTTATPAGGTLLREARMILGQVEHAVAAVTAEGGSTAGGLLRLGVPLELPGGLLARALAELRDAFPTTRVSSRHLSTSAQLAALRTGGLDLGLVRDRPPGDDLDSVPVLRESMGVLLRADVAAELGTAAGIPLESLRCLTWIGFARAEAPAWHDVVTAVLRGHGVDLARVAPDGGPLIAQVKLAEVGDGTAFTLAPQNWAQPLPSGVVWRPLVGTPLTRITWAAWPATSRRRDLAFLIESLEIIGGQAGGPSS